MMLHYAGIEFSDEIIALEDWPKVKPTMPPGPGAEFPGRDRGNRALPVLKLPNGVMMPESRDIAKWIASLAGPPLMPIELDMQMEAEDMFSKSQSLPGFWPTVILVRFQECDAEKIICGQDIGTAVFQDPKQTLIQEWYHKQQKWCRVRPLLLEMQRVLEARSGVFFGGDRPHYGELGIFVQVDALVTLFGREAALAGFSSKWCNWFD